MAIADYSPPVSQLLTYEEIDHNPDNWSGYLNLGITSEHIPELIQMMGDRSLYLDETDEQLYWAAPINAWRTLGQLKAEAAIEPLIDVVRQWGDNLDWDEWIVEEIPLIFGQIGAAALPALANYLSDSTQPQDCLETAISCIAQVGIQHPEQREQYVAILTHELEAYRDRDPEFNGFLVTALAIDLKAVEAAPVIEQAFNADKVDEAFMGDWGEVQVRLGLKTREEVPRKQFLPSWGADSRSVTREFDPKPSGFAPRQAAQKKAKRKQQKQARRKNRSKKK
ncbi:MAG: hypothetical protein KME15_10450 [Drouetiella hepatica Uher 2000/2452]|jgi:hypothetical protein|uniref:DUF1186 domain-containing protein n=1 Tax=Drouetiella hepatica Uher 2000/2452 TaxID=904376 RepID=A0A951QC14_9CYAN|nr:hypothetical protein [Drouetiella hepatica Uher 2000/2452]